MVGSGIAAAQMSPDDVGLQLLENSTATVFGLAVLILMCGPVSGAHFNPVVTAADWLLGRRSRTGISGRDASAYTVVQVSGAVSGAWLANVMFDRRVFELSTKDRVSVGHFVGEIVATAGLIALIFNLSIDQQLALKAATAQLRREFDGTFGVQTVERFLQSSYDRFVGRATVPRFLPLLAERFARQRLNALARVEGKAVDGKPTVMFICTHNAGRSQMALGYFAHLAGGDGVAWSGGSEPGAEINPAAIEAMAEVGIDITGEFPKLWTDEIVQAADVVITMGCGDACPIFPGKRYENWDLPDPAGQTVDAVRLIRDDIERRVRRLLVDLGVTANG